MIRRALTLCLLLAQPAWAGDINPQRAHFHYQMFCQGCHTPDGSGAMSVPRMKGHVGYFLQTQRGREYLVRVPGSATSALNDAQLAEVINWIIEEFAGDSADSNYQRYTPEEVARLRQHPLTEVEQYRLELLTELSSESTRE